MMGWVAGTVWLVAFIACSIIEIIKSKEKAEGLTLLLALLIFLAFYAGRTL